MTRSEPDRSADPSPQESRRSFSNNHTAAAKIKIAAVTGEVPYVKWPHTHEAPSAPVALVASRRYYLEVLRKPEAGSTQLGVRWRLPDGVMQRPIPAARLAPPDT